MMRRDFLKQGTAAGIAVAAEPWRLSAGQAEGIRERFGSLAAAVLAKASQMGASFADFHVMQIERERISARELMVQGVDFEVTLGCSVRLLVDGAWGFSAGADLSQAAALRLVESAVAIARAQAGWRLRPVEIEKLPAHIDRWELIVKTDPFAVDLEEKAERLIEINRAARGGGATYCAASFDQVRERKWLANSFGSRIEQVRTRVFPEFQVTVVDERKREFASRSSLAPPRAAGYEFLAEKALVEDAALAAEQAREILKAPGVKPGRKDLVIHPSNLWLTIHETVGHPTELDRALGFEADFAGTSFCTPDKLGKLRYASELVTMHAERTREGGLATAGYDDDGVKTAGNEFNIIDRGVFENFQTALGQAQLIGKERSNGCAYADGFASFPLQRMPNISLLPGADPGVTVHDLIAGVEDGIYVAGRGSWSIDMQRYNFQFTGQVFHRIRNGKLEGLLKDVAYQGNSVDFWNACDGLGGAPAFELGGAMNCGKGQPGQIAPVSHGAVPARFRQINVLNTAEHAGRANTWAVKGRAGCSGGGNPRWA